MKLLLITPRFPPACDGVGDYSYFLAQALAAEGFEVSVLTSRAEAGHCPPKVRLMAAVTRWGLAGLPRILECIKEVRPDWVLLQYVPNGYAARTAVPFYLVALVLLLRVQGIKVLTTFHEVALRLYWRNLRYVLAAVGQRAVALGLGWLSQAAVTSIGFFRDTLGQGKIDATVIPVGSNIPPRAVPKMELQRRRRRVAPQGEMIVATFGAGGAYRRHDLILEGARRFQEAGGGRLRLLFIGNLGPAEVEALHAEARRLGMEDALFLTGFISPEEVFKYLKVADLYVTLDLGRRPVEGGISTKSGSAMAGFAAGCPILSYRGDLTDPLFRSGENVFFLDSPDAAGVAKALAVLLSQKDLRDCLGREALRTWKENLSWAAIARNYQGLLLPRRPSSGFNREDSLPAGESHEHNL
jgi:glycosyltransferase involved in cell wall biosynthesis